MSRLLISLVLLIGCRPAPGTSYYDDQEPFYFDAGTTEAPEVRPTLPLVVDDWFGPSGYMGDGESGLIDSSECSERAPNALGRCHRFSWTRGEKGWAGVFWQYPDGNWGSVGGLEIPAGATGVAFDAWGETGTEVISFGAGMGDVDGFAVELPPTPLTTTPTAYLLDLTAVDYGQVVGGFVWTSASAGAGAGEGAETTFYIDNIRWVKE